MAQQFHDKYTPLEKVLSNISAAEKTLGKSFQERIQPSFYFSYGSGKFGAADHSVSAFSSAVTGLNTSWMDQTNPWATKVSSFNSLDTAALKGVNTAFSKLIKLERETSACASIDSGI